MKKYNILRGLNGGMFMGKLDEILYIELNQRSISMEEFITRYDNRIFSFVYKIVRNREAAMEITQDVILKAIKYISSYNSDKNFITWIFTIAKNSTYDYMRKTIKSNNIVSIDSHEAQQVFHSDTPEWTYQCKESFLELISLIDALPEKYKVLIQMKYMLELNYEEISNMLQIPVHKVQSRLYMARKKLQNEIEKVRGGIRI